MTNLEIIKITEVAENLLWNVTVDGRDFTFSQYSPHGQDFNIEIQADTIEELSKSLDDYYDCFDVSQEAYYWLDESGHGKNGAPYDMKDLYNDMEACEQMIKKLSEVIEELL